MLKQMFSSTLHFVWIKNIEIKEKCGKKGKLPKETATNTTYPHGKKVYK